MNKTKKVINLIDKATGWIISMSLLIITLIMAANVMGRYLIGVSIVWGEELTNYVIIAITFLGYHLCISRGMDMKIEVFDRILHRNILRWLNMFAISVALFFVLLVAFIGFNHTQIVFALGRTSPALHLPMFVPYSALWIGALLMSIKYVIRIIELIGGGKQC